MRSLRFDALWMLSENTKRAKEILFHPKANALIGTNHTGKSTIVRHLFSVFGCRTRPLGDEWDVDASVAVEFSVEGSSYTLLTQGDIHTLFDKSRGVIWATGDQGELRDLVGDLLGFKLPLTSNPNGEIRRARAPFFFIPFFIDQDGSWDSDWRTFLNLREFRQWERPALDLALGIRAPEYWSLSSELQEKKRLLDEISNEQRVISSARERLAGKFPRQPWFRDGVTFRRELKQLEQQAAQLSIEQDTARSQATETATARDSLSAQLRLIDGALGAHAEDMQFLDGEEIGTDIICPTCGTPHEHSFHERLNLEAEADELRQLRVTLSVKAKAAEKAYVRIAETLPDLDRKASKIDAILNTQKGKLRLREVVDRAGIERAFATLDEQKAVLDAKRGETSRQIEDLEVRLSALDNKERARSIREFFNERYSEFATQLEVPLSRRTRKGEVKIKPQQGGSGGPRAVLAYYFAIAHTACKYSSALIPPLVIDSPHQKAQDEINRPLVTEFIFQNRPPSHQLIVCLEEPLPSFVHLGNGGKTVALTVKYGLLDEGEFQHVASVLRPLMDSSVAHLRSNNESADTSD
jgi:hypothetical protein